MSRRAVTRGMNEPSEPAAAGEATADPDARLFSPYFEAQVPPQKRLRHVACVSWPRSGHHLLVRMLTLYFGRRFGYCEFYEPCRQSICCGAFPCARPGRIVLSKNHDFDLTARLPQDHPLIVQVRAPEPAIVSEFELHVANGHPDTAGEFRRFALKRAAAHAAFVDKWVNRPHRRRLVIDYERLTASPVDVLVEAARLAGDADPDRSRAEAAVEGVPQVTVADGRRHVVHSSGVGATRDIAAFRHYDAALFGEIARACRARGRDPAPSDTRAAADRIAWHHCMDLGEGVVTRGKIPREDLAFEAECIFRHGVAGRSVLDIATRDGFFAFEAKRRGARRVLATERTGWAGPSGRAGFDLAAARLGLAVETAERDVAEVTRRDLGRFDVVVLRDVPYPERQPMRILDLVSRIAAHTLVIATRVDAGLPDEPPALAFDPARAGATTTDGPWTPNRRMIEAALRALGFPHVAEDGAYRAKRPDRALFHAFRD